jgi:membrane protease YdiL (CAAX protease family)
MDEDLKSSLVRILPFLILPVIIGILIRIKKIKPQDLFLNKPASTRLFFAWTIGFLVLALLVELLLYKLNILEIDKWNHALLPSIVRITGAVILAPVAEELIFRGLILYRLTQLKISRHLAVFMQAVLFVLLHNFAYENTVQSNISVVQTLLDATLFAYAKYNTKSLYTPIAMHMTGNLIATLERFIF